MNRRDFIKGLSLAPAALLAAPVVAKPFVFDGRWHEHNPNRRQKDMQHLEGMAKSMSDEMFYVNEKMAALPHFQEMTRQHGIRVVITNQIRT